MDPQTIDPATVKPSAELDALIAGEWMGWREQTGALFRSLGEWHMSPGGVVVPRGPSLWQERWSPSTNPAHAGEARRKERYSEVTHGRWAVDVTVGGETESEGFGSVLYSETDNDKARAEALATCRAIFAAMKAKEE